MPRDVYFSPDEMSLPTPTQSGKSRADFVKKQKAKARKSRKTKKKFRDLVSKRSISLVIRESAAGRKYMNIRYKKATTGETKEYKVAPYSFRYMRDKRTGRRRKALYAYDASSKHIKAYYMGNIKSVQRTNGTFQPKWPVEISF